MPPILTLKSPSFAHQERIPSRHTRDGEDRSPPLTWTNLPTTTRELAIIALDPDAPTSDPWVHWIVYRIPASAPGLPDGVTRTEAPADAAPCMQGMNSWSRIGYSGPAPPRGHGAHNYHFTLYAVDDALDLSPGLRKAQLLDALEGHVLAKAVLIGMYSR